MSSFTTPPAAHSSAEWLAAGAALDRFAPPEGASFVASRERAERVRYGFRIGDLSLLISPDTGSEAIQMPPVFSVPNTAPWLKGMINLRGNLAPLFDLAALFGVSRSANSQALALILDKGPNAVGMIIDGLPQALTGMRRMNNLPSLPAPLEKYVGAGYNVDSAIWLEFHHEAFFQSLASLI
jgi:twitching motility protein PilI